MNDEIDQMKKSIVDGFKKTLGVDITLDPDADLDKFSRGKVLKAAELKAMKEGTVVWFFYKEWGDGDPDINQAMRFAEKGCDETWLFGDGSCFVEEIDLKGVAPDGDCIEDGCEGQKIIYHVIPHETDR